MLTHMYYQMTDLILENKNLHTCNMQHCEIKTADQKIEIAYLNNHTKTVLIINGVNKKSHPRTKVFSILLESGYFSLKPSNFGIILSVF